MYLFISLLYMFRATQCSSEEESNCINTLSGVCHSVYVTAWYTSQEGTLGCSKHVEKWNKYLRWKKCVKLVINRNYTEMCG